MYNNFKFDIFFLGFWVSLMGGFTQFSFLIPTDTCGNSVFDILSHVRFFSHLSLIGQNTPMKSSHAIIK